MFRKARTLLRFQPANGTQVLVRARVSLYESRGDFQLVVEQMDPAGAGALRLRLDELKRRLAAEGLFDERCKRPLPQLPRQVGLVTSPSGAAVRDLLSVLKRRFPALPIVIYPAQVQGEGAASDLVRALEVANARRECDVMVLARGGGSLEDLMAFNAEGLARAIRRSAIPVVTGVGHEIDLTIADLAADRRAATPSAAAELIAPAAAELAERVELLRGRLLQTHGRALVGRRQGVVALARHLRLVHPIARLQRRQQTLDDLSRRLERTIGVYLERDRGRIEAIRRRLLATSPGQRLIHARSSLATVARRLLRAMTVATAERRRGYAQTIAALHALSPLATLSRGYAIARRADDGRVLRDAREAVPGSVLDVQLARGRLRCRVEGETPDGHQSSEYG